MLKFWPYDLQGFCKALMTTIERLLGVLSVDRLVLPTAKNAESIWINKFGFRRMEDQQVKHLPNMLVFHCVVYGVINNHELLVLLDF